MTDRHPIQSEPAPPLTDSQLQTIKLQYIAHLQQLQSVNQLNFKTFNFHQIYPATCDVTEILAQVDDLKLCLDSFRPLDSVQVGKLEQAFDVEYTYDSNRIEGNTLTLQETALVLEKGITVAGKSVREHLEAINHQEAIHYIRELASEDKPLTEVELKSIHHLVLSSLDRKNAGIYRTVPVSITGSRHVPPQSFLLNKLMEDCFIFFKQAQDTHHSALLAAEMHERLVTIHPFIDGNGRTARLFMNLILLRNGFPVTNPSSEHRQQYYEALELAQLQGQNNKFLTFVLTALKSALIKYLEMVSTSPDRLNGEYFFRKIAAFLNEPA